MTHSFDANASQRKADTGSHALSRRVFLCGVMALGLAGCQTKRGTAMGRLPSGKPVVPDIYQARPNERFPLPAIKPGDVPRKFWRKLVKNPTGEKPGTLVVDTPNKYLYWVMEGGMAMRYGIGVGRQGFSWAGRATIAWKRAWPTWTPPSEMIARQPELEKWRKGMPPGLGNPLGARALYIFQNGKDTLYRLHGTNQPRSIGKSVSSGCIRLLNQDVIDLYNRVPNKSRIVVIPDPKTKLA
ncbi:MAG: L,D-transpeptidase [Cohaesibacter sp.]|nr:L,D-transpeptidase [Cohaesibacter sp.]